MNAHHVFVKKFQNAESVCICFAYFYCVVYLKWRMSPPPPVPLESYTLSDFFFWVMVQQKWFLLDKAVHQLQFHELDVILKDVILNASLYPCWSSLDIHYKQFWHIVFMYSLTSLSLCWLICPLLVAHFFIQNVLRNDIIVVCIKLIFMLLQFG